MSQKNREQNIEHGPDFILLLRVVRCRNFSKICFGATLQTIFATGTCSLCKFHMENLNPILVPILSATMVRRETTIKRTDRMMGGASREPTRSALTNVARLAILSPDLAKLTKFGPPLAKSIFDFTVYLAIFEPQPASTG